jgi:hypothetical protein
MSRTTRYLRKRRFYVIFKTFSRLSSPYGALRSPPGPLGTALPLGVAADLVAPRRVAQSPDGSLPRLVIGLVIGLVRAFEAVLR